jgi:Arc/MetJ family transcription regulator
VGICVKRRSAMATNLAIDPDLLEKALEVSGLKTKKETVNLALQEFINRHKQLEILDLFGKMDPDPNYDYKKGRTR